MQVNLNHDQLMYLQRTQAFFKHGAIDSNSAYWALSSDQPVLLKALISKPSSIISKYPQFLDLFNEVLDFHEFEVCKNSN